ncbi:fluoride efflux transporter FluC [Limnochorda pilosa]|uniref:Fluoride-specific ion channel FluC n=1 Tax=Limnochorda pilosa TaxID=1555112 RepID=A0A0K2SN15_LIMPI|nr:CrcB family protein [Limnochorda pilosa]BAS28506.1 camphor resistance protein CrcB [Limnochorda pilosa]
MNLRTLLLVAVGAAAGALARYALGGLAARRVSSRMPLGTLLVNGAGGFVAGWLGSSAFVASPAIASLLVTGFCGGLTTFSTFAYETVIRFVEGSREEAWANVMWNVMLTVGAAALGGYLART